MDKKRSGLYQRIENGVLKRTLWPLCRAQARRLDDKPADALYRFLCGLQFRHVYGFRPDFVRPRLFSEKLWSRMLHSRDPRLTWICDKLKVREYVASRVGSGCLIPLIWSGKEPEDIPFDKLPARFVMKANHGSGYNVIVTDKSRLDQEAAKQRLRIWLRENFALDKYLGAAWGYKNIERRITVESFIGAADHPPADFKFYCFSGRVELLTLHVNRYEGLKSMTLNRDYERLKFDSGFRHQDIEYPRPANYEVMVGLAEDLAAEFDFIRVDLYSDAGMVYFGELTPYPVGVSQFYSFDISSLDQPLGEKWTWPPRKSHDERSA